MVKHVSVEGGHTLAVEHGVVGMALGWGIGENRSVPEWYAAAACCWYNANGRDLTRGPEFQAAVGKAIAESGEAALEAEYRLTGKVRL